MTLIRIKKRNIKNIKFYFIYIVSLNIYKMIYDVKQIIKCQKIIRGYLIRNHILIPSSYYQTKKWRKNRKWYKQGKQNECEIYQKNLIEKIIKMKCNKTNDRINMETNEMKENKKPLIKKDGFEWSENFDGMIIKNNITYYFNLKFVCDKGGAQTRTLREVYQFVKCQTKIKDKKIFFINILDGDVCYQNMDKFRYLINKTKCCNIFIDDLKNFQKFWNKLKCSKI